MKMPLQSAGVAFFMEYLTFCSSRLRFSIYYLEMPFLWYNGIDIPLDICNVEES